jgi:hypothetical protein
VEIMEEVDFLSLNLEHRYNVGLLIIYAHMNARTKGSVYSSVLKKVRQIRV